MSSARDLMASAGVVPKKSKGQNFLIDDRVADRIVGYGGITDSDRLLEVGPGFGILTERLVSMGAGLTCIELDAKLAEHIRSTYGDRLTLLEGDAVKVPFPPFDVFVSNLPYSVSTPIIFKLLEQPFRTAVVMVQKEFADRMVADVGSPDYSRLTVNLFYRADCEIMEPVPASRFDPRPKVDSAVVRITPRPAPFEVLDERTFFDVTEACFNHRRKKIGTSLKNTGLVDSSEGIPYRDERIEDLRPSEIGEIADEVYRRRRCRRPRGSHRLEIQHVVFPRMDSDLARRYLVFGMGLFCISMAIGFITKASVGTSPITSIPYSLSLVFPQFSLGNFTIMFSLLLVLLQYILTDKKTIDRTVRINFMLEVVISFLFGYLVDLSMWLFSDYAPSEYWLQIASVVIGIFILAFGVYLQVVANVVMVPGDGFVYALTLRVKKSYGKVRVCSDTSMVIIAAVIGLLGLGNLGGVREGTIVCCIFTGLLARRYMVLLAPLTSRLVPGKSLESIAGGTKHADRRPRARPHHPHGRKGDQECQGQERLVPRDHIGPGGCARIRLRQPGMQREGPDGPHGSFASGRLRNRRAAGIQRPDIIPSGGRCQGEDPRAHGSREEDDREVLRARRGMQQGRLRIADRRGITGAGAPDVRGPLQPPAPNPTL